MDACFHCLEYKADVCPEKLKYVKEHGILNAFELRLMAKSQFDDKYYQLKRID